MYTTPKEERQRKWIDGMSSRLFEPVDIASLAIFRIMFGLVIVWEVWRYFEHDWIASYFIERSFYFKYYGFDWVAPWPGEWMYIHFLALGILGFYVAIGFMYRISSILLFLCFTYVFLLDETRYLNHLYLTALIAFLLCLIPVHRSRSIDSWRDPEIHSDTIPRWCLWLIRAQLGLVYFYAGIAKLNSDWLQGEPMGRWLQRRGDYPLVGPLLASESAIWFFSYGGIFFDLLIVPCLLWKPTRMPALASAVFFHVTNKCLFDIGIFPVMALAATLLFMPPDWPRRVLLLFAPLSPNKFDEVPETGLTSDPSSSSFLRRAVIGFLVVYGSVQVFVPLRHWAYPGDVHWTEEGHRFSWRMKLREKRARAEFVATDPATNETWVIDQGKYLSHAQRDRVGRWPDMCLQFAHFMAVQLRKEGHQDVEIRVRAMASLNGREPQLLIDPTVDLVQVPRSLAPADWILPLDDSL